MQPGREGGQDPEPEVSAPPPQSLAEGLLGTKPQFIHLSRGADTTPPPQRILLVKLRPGTLWEQVR